MAAPSLRSTNPRLPGVEGIPAADGRQASCAAVSLLHVSACLLMECYLLERDPCVAVWLSRQFRLISRLVTAQQAPSRNRALRFQRLGLTNGAHAHTICQSSIA
jgi:hypothetical protein